LAIWGIGVFTLTWEYRKTTWLLLTLIVIGANMHNKQVVQENKAAFITPK
jgi:hypothetical protein